MHNQQKTKKELRSEIIKTRDSISSERRRAKDRSIQQRLSLLEEYREAYTLLLFASFRSEVDTRRIIRDALMMKKRVVLPYVDTEEKELRLYVIDDIDELRPGFMGIPEPTGEISKEISIEEIDFVLTPGVAFDERGGRLGYGGGYYDRLLGKLQGRPPFVAVAYEEQLVSRIPTGSHDIRVDKIVTDERVIIC